MVQDVDDRVADDHDAVGVEPLTHALRLVLVEVRVDDVGKMVDGDPVLLFGHAPVVRAHAALDVHDRHVQLRGGDRTDRRVGVSEEHRRGGVEVAEHGIESRDDRRDDVGVRLATGPQVDLGRHHIELAEEDVLQVVRVMLARPDQVEFGVRVAPELLQDQCGADDVGANPEDECQAVVHGPPR